jgi:Arc/MetJ-type ribon-helix-helix transcriptional regulator
MTISLRPDLQRIVDEKVSAGAYASAEDLVRAALDHFLRQEDDFAPGELEKLPASGKADIEHGRVIAGKAVFDEIRATIAARRGGTTR